MQNDLAKLAPCPFCGGDGIPHGYSVPGVDGSASTGEVECHDCGIMLWRPTEAEAIAAWNRVTPRERATTAALAAELEALIENRNSGNALRWNKMIAVWTSKNVRLIIAALRASQDERELLREARDVLTALVCDRCDAPSCEAARGFLARIGATLGAEQWPSQ